MIGLATSSRTDQTFDEAQLTQTIIAGNKEILSHLDILQEESNSILVAIKDMSCKFEKLQSFMEQQSQRVIEGECFNLLVDRITTLKLAIVKFREITMETDDTLRRDEIKSLSQICSGYACMKAIRMIIDLYIGNTTSTCNLLEIIYNNSIPSEGYYYDVVAKNFTNQISSWLTFVDTGMIVTGFDLTETFNSSEYAKKEMKDLLSDGYDDMIVKSLAKLNQARKNIKESIIYTINSDVWSISIPKGTNLTIAHLTTTIEVPRDMKVELTLNRHGNGAFFVGFAIDGKPVNEKISTECQECSFGSVYLSTNNLWAPISVHHVDYITAGSHTIAVRVARCDIDGSLNGGQMIVVV